VTTERTPAPMTAPTPYPVIQELSLQAVPSRFAMRARRDLAELPQSPPGTALVFKAGGRFVVFDERRHLTGTEDFVLGALEVAVVNLRPHKFSADLVLPSARPSEEFAIRTTFEARVEQPEAVAERGAVDLSDALGRHLRKDSKLTEICATYPIEEIAKVRILVENRIASYYSYRGFKQDGVAIVLHLVEVSTPVELRERDRRERTAELDHEFQHRIDEFEHKKKLWLMEQEQERTKRESDWDREQRMRTAQLERDFAERNAERDREQARLVADWEHTQTLLEIERDNALRELKVQAEQLEAERAKRYIEGGVNELLAWAIAKGQITPLEMAQLRREDDLRALQQIGTLLNRTLDGPNGDLVTVDIQQLYDDLLERLTGHKSQHGGGQLSATDGLRPNPAIAAARPEEEDDENPPDEEGFLD
jgi:hypothetical protein